MSNLEKYHTINRTDLNDEFFFQSLLEAAFKHNLLADTEVENLQNQCLELLALKVEQYNRGYSSSIRVEVAESIMQSNLYTLGLYLKSIPGSGEMITELKTVSISDIYTKGRRLISAKLHSAKHLLILARHNRIVTKNEFYNSTINEGINQFFVGYNPDFEAHEIPAAIDYQLCNPIGHFAGIEYIQKYIEGFFYENEFCRLFPAEKIHCLLSGFDDRYEDLLINICDHVLTNALGCIMSNNPAAELNITAEQIRELVKRYSPISKNELNT
ncbi:MAG: DUF6179 domain-containing protein, partial [Bacillota bacterium]|nr:DUF6179 domain-containing protein [Bacillota bacterium]